MFKPGDLVRVVSHSTNDTDLAPVGSVGVIVDMDGHEDWPFNVMWFDTSKDWTNHMSEEEIAHVVQEG